GVNVFGVLWADGKTSHWNAVSLNGERAFAGQDPQTLEPFAALSALYSAWKSPKNPDHPPLTGGLVGFMGWESIRQLEKISDAQRVDYDLPGQSFSFVADLIAVNHKNGTLQLIVNLLNDGQGSAEELWEEAQQRLERFEQLLLEPYAPLLQRYNPNAETKTQTTVSKDEFLEKVATAKEYIRIGDAFQVVVSQRFEQELRADALDVYRALRALNPSPYMYVLNLLDKDGKPFQVVGSSPEALIKIHDGQVISHPIAGSRPRGVDQEQDELLETELLADDKEKSEHLMLVDLARNDLLRVCEADSVKVLEFMKILRFSHVMHIGSTVVGTLRAGETPISALMATFPAGTLSGAPKPRALEIITELEPSTRGVYGGVVGYFSFSGDADLAIAIRTATLIDVIATVQAGGGIVADSNLEAEYQESVNKAAAPMRAVAIANSMESIQRKS
ncbi:MAG: chorismate-binding protein, partial [Microbacteriaceae bacterium]